MYYRVFSVTVKPGKITAAIAHLKELVKHFEQTYGVDGEVMSNVTGSVYRHHLKFSFESLAQLERVETQMGDDEGFNHWFQESTGLLRWREARTHIFNVHD